VCQRKKEINDQSSIFSFKYTVYFQPKFIFKNAHVKLVKHTGLVSFIRWGEIFVSKTSTKFWAIDEVRICTSLLLFH